MKPSEAAEILKGIEEFEGNLPEDGLLVEEAWGMAISALEKQIPKRKLEKDPYNENLFILRCQICGALIGNYNKRLDKFSYVASKKYFCVCGQAIDFSEPQQEELDG